jgi:type IV pilus assembly protein PilW
MRRVRRAGFTLIELMVAILIGFAVVGALLAAYMASYRSTLHNDALSEVTEDATLALNAIRAQAAMAGYSHTTVNPAAQTMNTRGFPWLFGCSHSSFNGPPYSPITTPSACTAPASSNSDTLEVAYEANDGSFAGGSSNAILNAAGAPLDCLGDPFGQTTDANGNLYYLNDSKFFVTNGKLYCQGPGNLGAGLPLVDNVDQMTVSFGYSGSSSTYDGTSARITAYVPAPVTPAGSGDWLALASVTVCVQVHSTSIAIQPDGTQTNPLANYIDCSGQPQHSTDGLLRRSFSTTIVFQSRVF